MSGVVSRLHELPGRGIDPDDLVVALTFDDGPGRSTPAVIERLGDLEVPATFFVVGSAAANQPEQVTALADAGHTVGAHSWSHPRGDAIDDEQLIDEYERTAALVGDLTGRPTTYVRPTYRKIDGPRYASLLDGRGYTTVTWSLDSRDWESTDPDDVATRVLANLHAGAIVLLHDGGRERPATIDAVPIIVRAARLAGYRFVAL